MKIKKLFAAALAAGLCVVSAVTPAKADMSNVELKVDWAEKDSDFIRFSVLSQEIAVTDIYGITITFTCSDMSGGVGGGLIINCDSNNWDQVEWGNADAGKQISAEPTGNADEYTVTRLEGAPVFQADNTFANFCLSHWWGGNIVVTDAKLLGADGKALGSTQASAPTQDGASATLPKTGLVSGMVFLALGSMISGAGVVVAKGKKK